MKKLIAFVLLLAPAFSFVKAQDVIVLRNADEVQAKVLEISGTSVKYVDWDFPDGPSRIVDKSEVFFIKYQNGKKEVFSEVPAPAAPKVRGKYIHRIKPQGYVSAGMIFSKVDVGPTAEAVLGIRIYDYFFFGLELEYTCVFEKLNGSLPDVLEFDVRDGSWLYMHMLSIGANFKGYIPMSEKVFPFINFSLGNIIAPVDLRIHTKGHSDKMTVSPENLFNVKFGLGVDYRRLSVGIGYQIWVGGSAYSTINSGYIKVGVRL
ncbi:MAG: hypothetical protein NC324_05480 [Bacteroides sp.]|nr:hypothetical protein [Bacteroides sp.]